MSRDDLILEIIEKVHEQGQQTARKVEEIQHEQARHGVLHEVNASNLKEHMARTEAAENRLAIIEKHFMFIASGIKIVTGIAAIIVFFVKVMPVVIHLFQK
jgi:hypothetical protein